MIGQLYILTGVTGVGKTDLAIAWSQANDAEILSCDSTLFYRGMDIGTAKPTSEEQALVPHHGLDLVDVHEQYDVASYIQYAKTTIEEIQLRGKKVLITGGSGFYLKAFFSPVVDDIPVSQAIIDHLNVVYDHSGLEGLLALLNQYNPDGVGDLDIKNPRRVLKALARSMATGRSYPDLKADFLLQKTPFDGYIKHLTLLIRDEDDLKARIRIRAENMLKAGLIDEVKALIKLGIQTNPSAANAIGYREVIQYLSDNDGDQEALLERIIINTNQLVAKQRKWFRHQISPNKIFNLSQKIIPVQAIF